MSYFRSANGAGTLYVCVFVQDGLWTLFWIFFFKQKPAYELRISDWSSDVCSSDLPVHQSGKTRGSGSSAAVSVSVLVNHRRGICPNACVSVTPGSAPGQQTHT